MHVNTTKQTHLKHYKSNKPSLVTNPNTMLETNVRVDHAVSSVRILFVLRVPHALVQFVTDPVLVHISYILSALGSFACQHEVATTCQLGLSGLTSNQEVEVDE